MIEISLILMLSMFLFSYHCFPKNGNIRIRIGSPVFIVFLFIFYYVILAQSFNLYYDEFYYVGRDYKNIIHLGLISTLIFIFFYATSFFLTKGNLTNYDWNLIAKHCRSEFITRRHSIFFAYKLLITGYLFLFLWLFMTNQSLRLFYSNQESITGDSNNLTVGFLLIPFDFVIPAIVLLFVNRAKSKYLFLFIYMVICAAIGFRYRIMIVLLSIFCFYNMASKSTLKLYIGVLLAFILSIMYFALIGLTRTYNKGLDFDRLNNIAGGKEIFASFFSESNIMYGLSAVIEYCTDNEIYLFFSPYLYSLIMFIPRIVWNDKPEPENFKIIVDALGTPEAVNAGTAIPIWGEFFLSFGWTGVVVGAIALGFFSKRTFVNLCTVDCHRKFNNSNLAIYCCLYGFLFFILSRGYFAQLLPAFISIIFPLLYIKRRTDKLFYLKKN